MHDFLNQSPGPDQGETAPPAARDDAGREGSSGSAAQTAVRTRPSPPRVDRLPPYRVLLHNDDINDELDIVDALVELTPLDRKRAALVMLEAHTTGVALVLVTHKERAELYRDQFRSKTVCVTIEPAE